MIASAGSFHPGDEDLSPGARAEVSPDRVPAMFHCASGLSELEGPYFLDFGCDFPRKWLPNRPLAHLILDSPKDLRKKGLLLDGFVKDSLTKTATKARNRCLKGQKPDGRVNPRTGKC